MQMQIVKTIDLSWSRVAEFLGFKTEHWSACFPPQIPVVGLADAMSTNQMCNWDGSLKITNTALKINVKSNREPIKHLRALV